MKYYLAYGSNLSVAQMLERCPFATYVGYGFLHDYQLEFRRSFLSIAPKKGSTVPVVVWSITDDNEKRLDRYEGFPTFYRKETTEIEVLSLLNHQPIATVPAMVYIMNDGFPVEPPSEYYWRVCAEGYCRFGFDHSVLLDALHRAEKAAKSK